jgi:hypothetical protein
MSEDQEFWTMVRQILLLAVDAVERFKLHSKQRTADLRKAVREERHDDRHCDSPGSG